MAVVACQNSYHDFSESNQRRAGNNDPDAGIKHDPSSMRSNAQSPDASDSPSSDSSSRDSRVTIKRGASETESNKGFVERVQERKASTPTPTPQDPMNKPLDPVGHPVFNPNPEG